VQACDHDLRVWIPAELYTALKRLAREDDRPLSEYVRRLIRAHVAEHAATRHDGASPATVSARDGAGR
jgi:predicted DNA-binding protein